MFQPRKQNSEASIGKGEKTTEKASVQSVSAMRKENTSRAQQVKSDKEKHGAKHR